MEQPPIGQEVVVLLASGGETFAIWNGVSWVIGVDNNPVDEPLVGTVTDWHWRAE